MLPHEMQLPGHMWVFLSKTELVVGGAHSSDLTDMIRMSFRGPCISLSYSRCHHVALQISDAECVTTNQAVLCVTL